MGAFDNAAAAYRKASIETMSQRDLIVALYRGAERFINQGIAGIANGDVHMALTGFQKAKRIFVELVSTLNFEQGGDIAPRMRDLYLFFIGELVQASATADQERARQLLPVVATLREAWEEVPDEYANASSLPEGCRQSTLHIVS